MKSYKKSWWLFFFCSIAVVAALSWITVSSLQIEQRELEARAELEAQEAIRLALWRMDSAFTPILAQEAARDPEQYRPVYFEKDVVVPSKDSAGAQSRGGFVISPLNGAPSNFFKVYFQISPEGEFTSPQDSTDQGVIKDKTIQWPKSKPEEHPEKLWQFAKLVRPSTLRETLSNYQKKAPATEMASTPIFVNQVDQVGSGQSFSQQKGGDYVARERASNQAQSVQIMNSNPANNVGPVVQSSPKILSSSLALLWIQTTNSSQPELVLLRERNHEGKIWLQGIWANWPWIENWLLENVRDLLPQAKLVPVLKEDTKLQGKMLASIPALLEPGALPAKPNDFFSPLKITLLIVWLAVSASIAATGFMLRAAIDLGERRGRFVSAVTHELRTPLTTFTLYSQMLADGMIQEDAARQQYLETLKKESERLSRIVENVLLYARVEGRRALTRIEEVKTNELFARILPKLQQRAAECKMEIGLEESTAETLLTTDVGILEQILLNLVDNSCKYASSASDRRLHLQMKILPEKLEILYWDHGPGIPPGEEARIFEAFQRSSRENSGTIPGIGLGLSLSRAMARELGGELELRKNPQTGASFALTLPLKPLQSNSL